MRHDLKMKDIHGETSRSRTELCSTPNIRNGKPNIIPSTDTLWDRCSKYDRNHSSTLPELPNISFNLEKIHYSQPYQMQQTGPEEQVILAYFDHFTL
jgi:hypothetical protein